MFEVQAGLKSHVTLTPGSGEVVGKSSLSVISKNPHWANSKSKAALSFYENNFKICCPIRQQSHDKQQRIKFWSAHRSLIWGTSVMSVIFTSCVFSLEIGIYYVSHSAFLLLNASSKIY